VERDIWLMIFGAVISAIVAVPVAWAFFRLQARSAEQQADK
jgi:ABC-type Fe3+ transport system permease subunit